MYLDVQSTGALKLADATNCNAFHIAGSRASAATLAVDGLEFSDDLEHAFVAPALVERLAAGQVDDEWDDRFAAMIAYAGSKGWTDDAGRIQGHCEWDTPDDDPAPE